MAHYRETEKNQGLFLTVNLDKQIIPGTFEHTLIGLIDKKLDLSIFNRKYNNDFTGAAAINPKLLLKVILYCYSLGVISSRKIALLCKNHMIVKALAEDTEPHYTTISDFISGMSDEIEKVFAEVLLICNEMKLIGGKMFAIDGCRLPSNASKEWSGTKKELQEKLEKLQKLSHKIMEKHREIDRTGKKEQEEDINKLEKLKRKEERIIKFLQTHEDRRGAGGQIIKSNITDNESGKIKGPHGVIQGYNGLAVADDKSQIIIAANAYGSVSEGQFFPEMLDKTERSMRMIKGENPLKGTVMLGDNGFFSEENLQEAKKKEMTAVIPDEQFRNRDKELGEGERRKGKKKFDIRDFTYNKKKNYYTCPNGKVLVYRGIAELNRNKGHKYQSKIINCKDCPYIDKCLRTKRKKNKYRTIYIPISKYEENMSQKMREKIDTPKYKELYSKRLGLIEPVFANITYSKGISRFTLRGKEKINIQWKLYCIVHNIGKCQMAENKRKKLKIAA